MEKFVRDEQGRDAYLWAWAQTPWLFTPGIGVPKVPPTQEEIEECYRQLTAVPKPQVVKDCHE